MKHFIDALLMRQRVKPENLYADMFARALAACIDVAILFFLFFDFFYWLDQRYFPQIGMYFLQQWMETTDHQVKVEMLTQWMLRAFIQVMFFAVAIVGSQIAVGTTPGKWLVGLKIVRHTTHAPVESWRFILRFFAYIPACLPLMLGIIWMGFNKQRRGWHDYIAGTVVLNLRPKGWYWGHVKRGFRFLWPRICARIKRSEKE